MPPVNGLEAIGLNMQATAPTAPTTAPGVAPVDFDFGTREAAASSFADILGSKVDEMQGMQGNRDNLTLQAVTGDLQDVHDATIAAAEASAMMDLMVALRNTSLQSFNELMRIQA